MANKTTTKGAKQKQQQEHQQQEQQHGKDNSSIDNNNDDVTNTENCKSGHAAPVKTFAQLGLVPELVEACERLGFKEPTEIQAKAIPPALAGEDVIGLAQTGSGKTAAFVLPILQALLDSGQSLFACIMAPTRELVFQISQQIEALGGAALGVRTAVIVGGVDMMSQAICLAKGPHIVVATPGRLLDHLESTKGFSLRRLRYLVLDEADRLLDYDFGPKIEKILAELPPSAADSRRTLLFSATMTDKVAKLQRACISRTPTRVSATPMHTIYQLLEKKPEINSNTINNNNNNNDNNNNKNDTDLDNDNNGGTDEGVSVSAKYSTVSTLLQYYTFIPLKHKETYLAYVLNEHAGQSAIVFATTVVSVQRVTLFLRNLGFLAIPIHGQLPQAARLGALARFKAGARNILVATDVVARGLDLPDVDLVLNYELPVNTKVYVHRVGRTARAGRAGKAISFVTQYDVELFQRIEALVGVRMPEYQADKPMVMLLAERVSEACALAATQMREHQSKHNAYGNKTSGRKRPNDGDDTEEAGERVRGGSIGKKYTTTLSSSGAPSSKRHRNRK